MLAAVRCMRWLGSVLSTETFSKFPFKLLMIKPVQGGVERADKWLKELLR